MSAADAFGLAISIARVRLPRLRAVPRGAPVSGQGIAQIVVYAVVLVALAYPLGLYMARVYAPGFRVRWLVRARARLLPARAHRPEREQDWKSYAKTVARLHDPLLGAPLRDPAPAGAPVPEPGRPAGGAVAHRAEHDRELRHEHELAVLRRRVHDVVPDPDGRAGGAELRLGRGRDGRARRGHPRARRRSTNELGNFWVDLYRSLVYILLPLALILGVILISQGVPQTFDGHATATTLEGARRRSRAARSRRRSRSSSSARTAAASTTRTRPSRSRTRTASRTSSRCSRSC